MKIVLDTNALMVPVQLGVDIFSDLTALDFDEFFVPSGVVRELERLASSGRCVDQIAARVAISLLDRCKIVETAGNVDDAILALADRMGAAVLTNDAELKARLRDTGVSVVYVRQRSYLVKVP
ncbi:MAG: DNA-binding protein [Euryarchaeota archaeon]|nr:DNA-binding protein [Euryarchaeota archaeon]